jgi:glycosyltransferase involved in cell wall biosynthesis
MGRPILLSVDGEAREIVERSGGGEFVPPEDVGAMVDAIRRLTQDPDRAAEMGRRGRAFVMREFDRNVLAADYLTILEGVVARATSR